MTRAHGIGEVLAELRAEFPETTISKLRFLESEGLVEPERTSAGYRKYSRSDIARLRYVLTAQRDHYLPLRVIREHLAAIDGGQPPPKVAGTPEVEAPTQSRQAPVRSRAELAERTGISPEELKQVEECGLIAARADGSYGTDAVEVARAVAQLAGFGVQARHLRLYRSAADREIGLFNQVLAPIVHQRDGSQRAERVAAELIEASVCLHSALVRAGLRTTLEAAG